MTTLPDGRPSPVTEPKLLNTDKEFPTLGSSTDDSKNRSQSKEPSTSYANTLLPVDSKPSFDHISRKSASIKNGIHHVQWTEEEVDQMNKMENLQYVIIGKFSYGWPDLEELGGLIPKQCGVKGGRQIGLLRNRHILIKLYLQEDFLKFGVKKGILHHM